MGDNSHPWQSTGAQLAAQLSELTHLNSRDRVHSAYGADGAVARLASTSIVTGCLWPNVAEYTAGMTEEEIWNTKPRIKLINSRNHLKHLTRFEDPDNFGRRYETGEIILVHAIQFRAFPSGPELPPNFHRSSLPKEWLPCAGLNPGQASTSVQPSVILTCVRHETVTTKMKTTSPSAQCYL
jgi:hypothetical protein